MKRSFVRMLSGLLAAAMVIGIPVAMPVKSNAYAMVHSITIGTNTVKPVCNHVVGDQYTTLEHSKFVASTCREGGYNEYTCERCGQKVYEYYQMLGHDYSKVEDIAGSNSKRYTCSRCDHSFVALSSDIWGTTHEHDNGKCTIVSENYAPNHSVNGFGCTRYYCNLQGGCDFEQIGNWQPPKEHTYGDWSWEKKTALSCGAARNAAR